MTFNVSESRIILEILIEIQLKECLLTGSGITLEIQLKFQIYRLTSVCFHHKSQQFPEMTVKKVSLQFWGNLGSLGFIPQFLLVDRQGNDLGSTP